jgi:hypothetical protein
MSNNIQQNKSTMSDSNNDELDTYRAFETDLLDVSLHDQGKGLVNEMRKVCFHPRVMMKEILHIKNYSQIEVANSWYREKEMEQIRTEIQDILLNTELDSKDADYDFALRRGLEGMTVQGAKRQEQNRRAGRAAVLRDGQCSSLGSTNYTGIALAYSLVSQWSVMEAVQRARDTSHQPHPLQQKRVPVVKPTSNIPAWRLSPKQASRSMQQLLRKMSGC